MRDWKIEMEEFREETESYDYIDFDYEFDAVKFYDFNKIETKFEAEEAQRWFDYAGNYRPSRLNDDEVQEAHPLAMTVLSRNLNFMNPTASQLAKQNYVPEIQWEKLLRRSERWCEERQMCSRSVFGAQAPKRQKLEFGFLRKDSHLKRHDFFLHENPKKVVLEANTAIARPGITIPREPFLATASGKERRRFRAKLESAENTRQYDFTFRARPLNRKILKAPSLPILKKSTPRVPDFQVFHLRTLQRAIRHASCNDTNIPQITSTLQSEVAECRRANSGPILKEKLEALDKFRIQNKDLNLQTNKKVSKEPPIESFGKLSLVSEDAKPEAKVPPHCKVSKENEPAPPLDQDAETLIASSQRHGGSSYKCGAGQRIHSIGLQINIYNRSLDMR